MNFLVTIKLPKNLGHDPHNKKTGPCPVDRRKTCTDMTGEHHTILCDATSEQEVREVFNDHHITRIEYMEA